MGERNSEFSLAWDGCCREITDASFGAAWQLAQKKNTAMDCHYFIISQSWFVKNEYVAS